MKDFGVLLLSIEKPAIISTQWNDNYDISPSIDVKELRSLHVNEDPPGEQGPQDDEGPQGIQRPADG
ncbi:unnamed protein product [Cercopithifilaria johnstoni]|uniref:Uncharacterized protein n=1 Tax=Cercopithifilaria johnstoni TaxID=2874296 RepID=A0A8J2LWP4_9BILA|nr:unnamed protein product [Cercopithifilaria johnstoni]